MLPSNPNTDISTPQPNTSARRNRKHKQTKDSLAASPNPAWVDGMVAHLQPMWARVPEAPVFEITATGTFPEASWRRTILEFWCVVEAFPKYMGLTLAKTTFGRSPRDYLAREWLIGNIAIESMHAAWYIDWSAAHGITESELTSHRPCPEVAALHEWLFSVAHRGSLAQAVAAINYAIEGTTGAWTKKVYPAFEKRYEGIAEIDRSIAWLKAHAKYDDLHPIEALEIMKLATRPDEQVEVVSSVQRSLELFARGFEWCHQHAA
jgi:pyrroloquinoline quinone (PQQ) biosynthesis protein C